MPACLQINCFQDLVVKRCICEGPTFFCCRRRRAGADDAAAAEPHVLVIQDISLDLCVVSAPHRHLTTLGEEPSDDRWDFMMVDREKRAVMIAGERFAEFAVDPAHVERVDAARGLPIDEVFPRAITDILHPLVEMVLQGRAGQLHTIFRSKSLTLFASPVLNEAADVTGATVVYRPTKYAQADIASLLSRDAAAELPTEMLLPARPKPKPGKPAAKRKQ